MKLFVFLIIVSCAVKCDESGNYYVIERPSDPPIREIRPFQVYWNVPTFQCKSKKISFEHLFEKYGIIQNQNDSFQGEQITILYDPGLFPAILKEENSGKLRTRNGGVPQEGNLDEHLTAFRYTLDQNIPDPNFHGIGIIDFESWRPVFRQNSWGVLTPYRNLSLLIEKRRHPWWTKNMIEREAKSRFERAGREFMQATAALARLLRPHAKWGYYGFPYCFNMAGAKPAETCSSLIQKENDQISWLWSESTALYPSVYSSKNLSSAQLAALIRGRVAESARVGRGVPILPYFWFKYRDAGFMSEVDLKTALKAMYKSHTSGFILWGSSNDVNTVTKCEKLKTYLDHVLGPEIAKYTKETYTRDEPYNINNVTNQNNITTLNPLYFLSEHSKDDENQKVDSENEEMDISSSEITQSEIVDDKVPISTNNDLKTTDENNILLDILISLLGNIQHNYDNKTTELTLKKIAKDRKKGTPIHDTFTQISDNKNDFTTSSPLNGLKKKGTIFSILGALYPPKNTTVFDDTASTIDESMYYDYNHTTVEITSTTKDSLITERNYKSTTVDILYDDNNFTMYYNQDTFPDEELNYTTVTENLTETTSTVSYDKDGSKAIILFDYQFSDPKNNEQNSINTEVGDNTEKNRPPIVFDTPIKATTSTEYLDQESTADFNGSTHEGVMSTTDTMTPEDHTYKDTVADDYENEDVQVPGSSQVDRKYFICLYFYFYLMSKCFCDMCGQC